MDNPSKILIIRFSSIGDIVLTSPVIRCLKQQTNAEIHFVCKSSFKQHLEHNPYIDRLWCIDNSVNEIISELQAESFDFVVDLHNNIRSQQIKKSISAPSSSLKKHNIEKWIFVNLGIDKLPNEHIVDRYLDTVESLSVKNDSQGLDYFYEKSAELSKPQGSYVAAVIGGQHDGKRLPAEKWVEIGSLLKLPLVLLGGNEDLNMANEITSKLSNAVSYAGKCSFYESTQLIEGSECVISNDTGLMHVASALKKNVISVWGQTSPRLGMYPYMAGEHSRIFEPINKRTLSKLGNKKTRIHAMSSIDSNAIADYINSII